MNKSKVWLAQNQDNVFEWGDIFFFIEIALCKSKLACWSSIKRTSSSSYRTQLVLAMIYLEIPNLVLNNNHSLTHYGTYFLGSFYFSLITCSVGWWSISSLFLFTVQFLSCIDYLNVGLNGWNCDYNKTNNVVVLILRWMQKNILKYFSVIFDKSTGNSMGDINGTRTVYSSGAPEFTPRVLLWSCCWIFSFLCSVL
jgi:hypothetical protein